MPNITRDQVLEFLRDNPIMNIACELNGEPISSVVLFAVDNDFTIYFATHSDSYKARALENNNKISFSVWENGEYLIQAKGKAIANREGKLEIFEKLSVSVSVIEDFWPPLFNIEGSEYVVYEIKPTWMRVLDLDQQALESDASPFTEIDLNS